MIIISFGHCHGNWHSQIRLNSTKFVLFLILGTYALSIDWVDFLLDGMAQNSCHLLQGFRVG